jgi:hypothetical protein
MSSTKLDPEFKVKWLAALRSGRYRQGKHQLRQRNKTTNKLEYCCIGVACNLVDKNGWKVQPSNYFNRTRYGNCFNWLAFESHVVQDLPFVDGVTAAKLAAFNDDADWDFHNIADWIEEYL